MPRPRLSLSIALFPLAWIACGDDTDDSGSGASDTATTESGGGATDGGSAGTTTDDPGSGGSTGESSGSTSGGGGSTGPDGTAGGDTTAGGTTGDATAGGSETGDTGGGTFTLTSTDFVQDGTIPSDHHIMGGNVSPQLAWENPPAGTMGFAVFFHDVSISYDHSAIWNIPSSVDMLPRGVEAEPMPSNVPGAVQCRHWNGGWGYGGPGSSDNTYMFTLHAIDVETIPDIDQDSSLTEVKSAFEAHSLGTATLSGQTAGPP